MISSIDLGSAVGLAALRAAIASISAISAALDIAAGNGLAELRQGNTLPDGVNASRTISSGVRPVRAAFAAIRISVSWDKWTICLLSPAETIAAARWIFHLLPQLHL